jgi:hypothetical protein
MFTTLTEKANAIYFPVDYTWPQPDGLGSAITLSYSYNNLLDSSILDFSTGQPIPASDIRGAFEAALWDYANILPIHFVEVADNGPLPETGEYDPTGLANIRVGQVAHINDANAYAYFPFDEASGLAGDIVFNADRFGNDWTLSIFYGVAQHELGHSLGMGHALPGDSPNLLSSHSVISTDYTGPRFPLSTEMITALQNAYGSGVGSVTPVPLPPAFTLLLAGIGVLGRFRLNLSKIIK